MPKNFNIYNYNEKDCPMSVQIERIVNDCGSPESHLSKLNGMFSRDVIRQFMIGCLTYWSETERYDDRNRFAALASRVIVEHFPKLKRKSIPGNILKECFAFTTCAHRYLQNEFFKALLKDIEKNDDLGIFAWFDSQEFVYNSEKNGLIPYREYLSSRS